MKHYKPSSNLAVGVTSADDQIKTKKMICVGNDFTGELEAITGFIPEKHPSKAFTPEQVGEMLAGIEQANLYKYSHELYEMMIFLMRTRNIESHRAFMKVNELMKKIGDISEPVERIIGSTNYLIYKQHTKKQEG